MNKDKIIDEISDCLLIHDIDTANKVINQKYPFKMYQRFTRNYTLSQKMNIFLRDGFIDRYTGEKLVIPGLLKILSLCCPESFPYHKNWKLSECHIAYWELSPTVDHLQPIALGGTNNEDNWVTTSMLNNSIKSNWTLAQLHWKLHNKGDILEWDGLTKKFITLVDNNPEFLQDNYIKNWYKVALKRY